LATQNNNQELINVQELLESGAHFGHQTHRWNPKMRPYIFEARNGIHIIDLAKTMFQIRKAVEVVRETVARRKSILFVGTKKQAKTVVKECAESIGQFYVCERWLGGMLTNFSTIRKSVEHLKRVEKRIATGGEGLTKKELSLLEKEKDKLDRNLSGIRYMNERKLPGLVIVIDPNAEHIAVAEANKLGIPVMALVDTNCNPDPINYVIACNDDSLKSIKVILQVLTKAIDEKRKEMSINAIKGEESEVEAVAPANEGV
jgi:small subunit ribosomal protein S2